MMTGQTMVKTGAAPHFVERFSHWWKKFEEGLVGQVEDKASEIETVRGTTIVIVLCIIIAFIEYMVKGQCDPLVGILGGAAGSHMWTRSQSGRGTRTQRKEIPSILPTVAGKEKT